MWWILNLHVYIDFFQSKKKLIKNAWRIVGVALSAIYIAGLTDDQCNLIEKLMVPLSSLKAHSLMCFCADLLDYLMKPWNVITNKQIKTLLLIYFVKCQLKLLKLCLPNLQMSLNDQRVSHDVVGVRSIGIFPILDLCMTRSVCAISQSECQLEESKLSRQWKSWVFMNEGSLQGSLPESTVRTILSWTACW